MLIFCLALILGAGCVQRANAGIIEDYPLGSFTLTNSNGDGTVFGDASSITLVGPNNGSGLPGRTDLLTTAKSTGLIQFRFLYSTLDNWWDDPTAVGPLDYAGYVVGSTFVELANRNGQSGTVSFPVTVGQTFGFRIVSADNFGEPGILTISNAVSTGVPEPGTWSLMLAAGAATAGFRRIRRAAKKEKHV